MNRPYDVLIQATIEIGGKFEAESSQDAIAQALLELRSQGEISNTVVERCIFLDEEDPKTIERAIDSARP